VTTHKSRTWPKLGKNKCLNFIIPFPNKVYVGREIPKETGKMLRGVGNFQNVIC